MLNPQAAGVNRRNDNHFGASNTVVIMTPHPPPPPPSSSLRSNPDKTLIRADLQRVASLRCNHFVEYELGHEKNCRFVQITEKSTKKCKTFI
jgi:hypothetical protein